MDTSKMRKRRLRQRRRQAGLKAALVWLSPEGQAAMAALRQPGETVDAFVNRAVVSLQSGRQTVTSPASHPDTRLSDGAGTALVALACTARFAWACLGLYAAGIGWIVMLASLNVAAHAQSPAWIRARALAGYVLVLQGGMAAGSAVWGMVASSYGLGTGLALAGTGLLGGLLTMRQYRLGAGNG